jgi:hypothetical protein
MTGRTISSVSRSGRIVVGAVIGALALGVAVGIHASPDTQAALVTQAPPRATGPLKGQVTSKGVGPLRFGAPPAHVRAWAGPPEFTSPPADGYPVPAHPRDTLVIGYHCDGFGGHSCHTLFGFRNGRLATFTSESPLFRTTSGVHPGMDVRKAVRLHPGLHVVYDCPSWRGKVIPKLAVTTQQQGRVFTLYASGGSQAPIFGPHC